MSAVLGVCGLFFFSFFFLLLASPPVACAFSGTSETASGKHKKGPAGRQASHTALAAPQGCNCTITGTFMFRSTNNQNRRNSRPPLRDYVDWVKSIFSPRSEETQFVFSGSGVGFLGDGAVHPPHLFKESCDIKKRKAQEKRIRTQRHEANDWSHDT